VRKRRFSLDLQQSREVNTITLWNTHNNYSNDRGTRTFRVWASDQWGRRPLLIHGMAVVTLSMAATVFFWRFVPETKGKSLEEITRYRQR